MGICLCQDKPIKEKETPQSLHPDNQASSHSSAIDCTQLKIDARIKQSIGEVFDILGSMPDRPREDFDDSQQELLYMLNMCKEKGTQQDEYMIATSNIIKKELRTVENFS
jgi:hypothetical protein